MKSANLLHKIISQVNHDKFVILFLTISSIYLFLISRYTTVYGPMISPDSIGYIADGEKILQNIGSLLTISYSVVYPFLIACVLSLGLSPEQSAILPVSLSYALFIISLFYIGKEISNWWLSIASCIIFIISADFLVQGTKALTEMIYLSLSMYAILFLILYVKYRTSKFALLSGVFCTLSALSRTLGVVLILTGIVTILIGGIKKKKFKRDILAFLLPLIPWAAYMYNIKRMTGSSFGGHFASTAIGYWPDSSIIAAIDRFFDSAKATAFYSGSESVIILAFIIFIISIIYIYKRGLILPYMKNIYPVFIYVVSYLIILFFSTADIWFGFARIQTRYILVIVPFIILLFISAFHFVHKYLLQSDKTIYKNIFQLVLITMFLILVVQQFDIYHPRITQIRAQSIADYSDGVVLSRYISEYNISSNDYVYFDAISYGYLSWVLNDKFPNIKRRYITSAMPNATILDNLTFAWGYGPSDVILIADLIRLNNNSPIYLIAPFKVSQSYMEHPPKDICLIDPAKFSRAFICRVDFKNNTSCSINPFPRDYPIDRSTQVKTALAGNLTGKKHDQLLILKSNSSKNHLQILDFAKGSPARVEYDGQPVTSWLNANRSFLSGDFMCLGYDQAFHIGGDKIVIEDFSQGKAPAIIRYSEVPANNFALKNLEDADDAMLAGDFLGRGYSQVLFVDRKTRGGKLVIADFSKGKMPEMTEISEIEGNSTLLSSLLDDKDKQFSGDFIGLGYSQLLMMNCKHTGAKEPKIIIADFSEGKKSASIRYLENWGESAYLGGWLDANDTQLVGDFMGLGHSQVLFVNHGHAGGKITIADFSQGKSPANIRYWESWDKGTIFQGWLSINDTRIAGDFKELGYSQVLFLNNSIKGSNATIVDFINGKPEIAL